MPTQTNGAAHDDDIDEQDGPDEMQLLHNEIEQRRLSIVQKYQARGAQDATPKQLVAMLAGDILPMMKKMMELSAQLRDGTVAALEDMDNRIDAAVGRIDGIEEPTTQFLPEDAERFQALVDGIRHFIAVARPTALPEAIASLDKLDALAVECAGIIEENTLDDDDGEDEDGEDEEEDEPEAAVGQA